jgi:hypothetical protein
VGIPCSRSSTSSRPAIKAKHFLLDRVIYGDRLDAGSSGDGLTQVERLLIGDQILHDLDCSAAQGKGVVAAFGRQAGSKEAGKTIEPVGQCQRQPRPGGAHSLILLAIAVATASGSPLRSA